MTRRRIGERPWLLVALVIAVAAGAVAGCTTAGGSTDAGSPGACAVPIADCTFGLFFATCGGSTPAMLACAENSGRCKWFTGGCPIGYRASDCASGNPCCHSSSDGPWPFDESTSSFSAMGRVEAANDLAAMGALQIDDRVPATLAVSEDPSLGPPSTAAVTCSPGSTLQVCGDGALIARSAVSTDRSRVFRFASRGLLAQTLLLELVPGATGLVARMFVRDEADSAPPSTAAACRAFQPAIVSGTLRLSTLDLSDPTALHGALSASSSSGDTVAFAF